MRFDITGPTELYEDFYRNFYEQYYDLVVSDHEGTYGVHDVSAHAGDLEGFTSYEIDPDQYIDCIVDHRKWFIENTKFEIGPVYEVKLDEDANEIMSDEEAIRRDDIWDKLDAIRRDAYSDV